MNKDRQLRVVHMVTSAQSIGLMKGQLGYLKEKGYLVTVIASPGKRLDTLKEDEGVIGKAVKMERTISPFCDLVALLRVVQFFLELKPHICNAGTPKAGLIGMIAAWITKVPFKVYTIRGLPFEGSNGIKRKILLLTEKIACACADRVICISPSVKKIVIANKLVCERKVVVFGAGSSNGLQLDKYILTEIVKREVLILKEKYKIERGTFIIGYVGRINNFKGVKELVDAFELLQIKYSHIKLLLIGKKEDKDSISKETNLKIRGNSSIIEIGYQNDLVPYYYLMDVLAFPTYREGFGNVSIEAQATGTPVVVTKATGVIDTIVDGETGFLVDVGDVESLKNAMEKYIENPELVISMGERARKRVFSMFDSHFIWQSIDLLYKSNIDQLL